jgi:hypothetical protein
MMTVTVQSDKGAVFLTIYGVTDSSPYVRAVSGQNSFSFKLPYTQDCGMQCVSIDDNPESDSVAFEMKSPE